MTTTVSGTGGITYPDGTTQASAASGGGLTWQAVVTANTTVSAGNAYAISTVNGPKVITLPASPGAGNTVQLTDYARTWSINSVTVNRNGSNITNAASNLTLSTNGASVALVYIDAAQGWIPFNGFASSPVGTYTASYFIASGGGSSTQYGGGGGGGGYLTGSNLSLTPGTAYTITIGAGGAGQNVTTSTPGQQGSQSSAFGYSPVGGGYGGANNPSSGGNGGSGGGVGTSGTAGTAGTGTAGQGNNGGGGSISSPYPSGGGGGAGANGGTGSGSVSGGGGIGVASSISGASVYYCGGGSGGYRPSLSGTGTAPAAGGGGAGSADSTPGSSGTANTGGGGGGSGGIAAGGNGGSGVVIISYLGSQRGTGGTITSSGGYTIHTFTSSGTYTA